MQPDDKILTDFQVLVISTSVVLFILLVTIVVLFLIFQRRKIQFIQERNAAEKKYLEEVALTQMEIQENTLKNISWELHDNIGQLLSVANIQLNRIEPGEIEFDQVDEVRNLIQTSLKELRALSRSLNNEVVSTQGLISSIENELARFNRLNFLETEFTVNGDPWSITKNNGLILYRIVQEFFSNVIKHAKASKLEVMLTFDQEKLQIFLKDNGVGFDADSINPSSGLINMQSRAQLIDANILLTSKPAKGTQLEIDYIQR